MKKITLTCAIIISAATAFAQAERPEPNYSIMAESRAKEMKQEYYMNDDQYKKAVAIETEFCTKMHHADGTPTKIDEAKEFNDKRDAAYKKLLPPDQWAKYDAKRQRNMNGNMQAGATPPASSSATKR